MNKKCIHKIKNESNNETVFIILCARKSNNRGYKNIPLTPVSVDETLIDRQIKTIRKNYTQSEIIIVSGFEHDRLIEHIHKKKYDNIRIAENKNYKDSTVLDGWRFALNIAIKNDICIIHGDRLFSSSCIKSNNSSYTSCYLVDKNNYNLGIIHSDNQFINMSYGLKNAWSEIFYIKKKDFDIVRSIINTKQRKIYTIESFINELSNHIKIAILNKNSIDIKVLKEIQ